MELTIYSSLELLTADFAGEFADASFFVQFNRNGLLVVAEKAWEIRWKWLFLHPKYKQDYRTVHKGSRYAALTFFGPCGLREDFLRLPYDRLELAI